MVRWLNINMSQKWVVFSDTIQVIARVAQVVREYSILPKPYSIIGERNAVSVYQMRQYLKREHCDDRKKRATTGLPEAAGARHRIKKDPGRPDVLSGERQRYWRRGRLPLPQLRDDALDRPQRG